MSKKRIASALAALLFALPVFAAGDIVLARQGRTAWRIVVPNDGNAAVEYAAGELQAFLKQSTGADFPVLDEARAGGGPAIRLGRSRKATGAGLPARAGALGEDGVLIKTVGGDLIRKNFGLKHFPCFRRFQEWKPRIVSRRKSTHCAAGDSRIA
jgi:hypothetical protein